MRIASFALSFGSLHGSFCGRGSLRPLSAAASGVKVRGATGGDVLELSKLAAQNFAGASTPGPLFNSFWLLCFVGLALRVAAYRFDEGQMLMCAVGEGGALGMVEVSLQPVGETSTLVPMPLAFKRALSSGAKITGGMGRREGLNKWGGELAPYISNLLVDEGSRRMGIGKELMSSAYNVGRKTPNADPNRKVYLHVDSSMERHDIALKMYEGLGFDLISTKATNYNSILFLHSKKI